LHARYYKPLFGKYLSLDRHPGTPNAPGSWNRYGYANNNPLSYVDPNGLKPLPANWSVFFWYFLGPEFALKPDIHTGLMASAVTSLAGAGAVTHDFDIYLSARAGNEFEKQNPDVVPLIGHELVHVLQYQHLGSNLFLQSYLQNYVANRHAGMSDYEAYSKIIQEAVAKQIETAIANFLKANPDIKETLESGTLPLSQEQIDRIASGLAQAEQDGTIKKGYQFIEGFLVRVQ
jgi:hypothetical protein